MNSFKCPNCGEYTRHIIISLREAAAIDIERNYTQNTYDKICAAFVKMECSAFDIVGGGSVLKHVVGISPYKCCKCGRCSFRESSGKEKEFIGYSK